jgi:hypothetical protein
MRENIPPMKKFKLKGSIFLLAMFWSIVVFGSLFWNLILQRKGVIESARIEARTSIKKDVAYRFWNSSKGGVYAPISDATPPNPFLYDMMADRDITTINGEELTLINPAYMTRQVYEISAKYYNINGHLTSLRPVRPGNAPDPWEKHALMTFEKGNDEYSSEAMIDNEPYLRLMTPLVTTESCLKCHAAQGYKVNDIRGGISVATPLNPLYNLAESNMIAISTGHLVIWLIGFMGIIFGTINLNRRFIERDRAIKELKLALSQIEVLDGLVPICANCKKIRDDKGYWNQIEEYLTDHTDAEFSHGMCPDCTKVFYPEMWKEMQ